MIGELLLGLLSIGVVGALVGIWVLCGGVLTPFMSWLAAEICIVYVLGLLYYLMRRLGIPHRTIRFFPLMAGVTLTFMIYMPVGIQLASFAIWGFISLLMLYRVVKEYHRRKPVLKHP
jgi:hypothetical protein